MAANDPQKRRPQPPPAFDPSRPISVVRGLPVQAPALLPRTPTRADIRPPGDLGPYRPVRAGLQDIVDEYQRVGGGAQGVGAAGRSVLGQVVAAPMSVGRNAAAGMSGALGMMASPFVEFGRGLAGIEAQSAAPARASASNAPVPNFNVPGRTLAPPLEGEALLRSGVTAPAATPRRMTPEEQVAYISAGPPRNLTPDGPPVYSTGSATRGTAQYGNRAVQSIPSDYGAGRTNVAPSFAGAVPTSVGGSAPTYNPNSVLNFTPANPATRSSGAGRAESVALARSRELDGLFQSIMQKAQREPQSYGELFARKGTLASLNALAGLSQAAGSNYIQGAGDVLQAETSRYGTDRSFESELGRQAVQARGQDLTFESNLGQQNVASQGNLLQALIAQQGQGVTERVGNRQAAATLASGQARAAAAIQAAKEKSATDAELKGLMLSRIYQTSGTERQALIDEYVTLFRSNPLVMNTGS